MAPIRLPSRTRHKNNPALTHLMYRCWTASVSSDAMFPDRCGDRGCSCILLRAFPVAFGEAPPTSPGLEEAESTWPSGRHGHAFHSMPPMHRPCMLRPSCSENLSLLLPIRCEPDGACMSCESAISGGEGRHDSDEESGVSCSESRTFRESLSVSSGSNRC